MEPNVISYIAAIPACEKGQQFPRALSLLAQMEARGLEPNVVSYIAAVHACGKGQQ